MAEDFDPYRKWLGIPPKDQPPHHYRLLGIAPFEDDPDVIENAGDRQMAHVRTFQTGRFGAVSQHVLNELAAARRCLLDASKKSAYDALLRSQMAMPSAAPSSGAVARHGILEPPRGEVAVPRGGALNMPPGPSRKPAVESEPADERPAAGLGLPTPVDLGSLHEAVSTAPIRPVARTARTRSRKRPQTLPIVVGLVGVSILALIVAGEIISRNARSDGGDDGPTPSRQTSQPEPPSSPDRDSATAAGQQQPPGSKPPRRRPKPDRPRRMPGQSPPGIETRPHTPLAIEPSEPDSQDLGTPADDGFALAPARVDAGAPETETDWSRLIGSAEAQPGTLAAGSRAAVPDTDARRTARQRLGRIYGRQFGRTKTPEEKLALIAKLARAALEEEDDALKYVMLEKSRDLAIELPAPAKLCETIDLLAVRFAMDPLVEKSICLTKSIASAKTAADSGRIYEQADAVYRDALAQRRYDAAVRLAEVALLASKKARRPDAGRVVTDELKRLRSLAAAKSRAAEAAQRLKEEPDDPQANYELGAYLCFHRDDWHNGLPLLARGGDEAFRDLAARELADAGTVDERIELAERWMSLGRRKGGAVGKSILSHAKEQFDALLTSAELKGLVRTKVRQRIDEIDAKLQEGGEAPPTT